MRPYPYSNIKSKNLKALLLAARTLAGASYLIICIFLFSLGASIFGGTGGDVGVSENVSVSIGALESVDATTAVWSFIGAIAVLAFSGLCAAVVSCEHKLTTQKNS